MSDSERPTKQAVATVPRDAQGRVLPGHSLNPTGGLGRPKLPDWLKGRSEKALLYIADVADGTEFAEPELRLKAAQIIVDRYYGKPKESVEHSGEVAEVRRVELAIVRVETKPLAPASKTLTLDAE